MLSSFRKWERFEIMPSYTDIIAWFIIYIRAPTKVIRPKLNFRFTLGRCDERECDWPRLAGTNLDAAHASGFAFFHSWLGTWFVFLFGMSRNIFSDQLGRISFKHAIAWGIIPRWAVNSFRLIILKERVFSRNCRVYESPTEIISTSCITLCDIEL